MSDGFRDIPGVPEGWELVRIGTAYRNEFVVTENGVAPFIGNESKSIYAIVRKIEKPKRWRPFANAEEFKPHRDRWWRYKLESKDHFHPPGYYSDDTNWQLAFEATEFDDGSPYGVEVTDE